MTTDLEDFHHELIADVQCDADVLGLLAVEAFFEKAGDVLTEAGELDSANRAYYNGLVSGHVAQIDGYGGDPRDGDGILSLVLCDFKITDHLRLVHKDKLQVQLNQIYRFLKASLNYEFRNGLEETSAGFGVADLVANTWAGIKKIKLIIVTNAESRARADSARVKEFNGKPITLSVWDLKRLKQFMEQGQTRDNSILDFEKEFGGGIPLLSASGGEDSLVSYLAVIPGKQLADVYEKWGPRLLESNVRSFLQARSNVNKGIRNTIRDEPRMFFSYNNGLSTTVESIETKETDKGLLLLRAENLQIVNGGQTTASIHAASKTSKEQIEHVYVQMKMTIVPPEQTEETVPSICQFANSQNRVNAADFFSNHPFHINTERLSRRTLAPAGRNGYRETKWFYERSRGQYADEKSRRTPAERKKFDAEYPRGQFITKTDLAKYENTWACLPYVVSRGAQKNFVEFAKQIGKLWGKEGANFHVLWFKRMIAMAIVFKSTERLVSGSIWYEGGYRANIVTYAIAKMVHDVLERNMMIDLDTIWRHQELSEGLIDALNITGAEAQHVITNPPEGIRNCSEWAKKQACWEWLSQRKLNYSEDIDQFLILPEIAKDRDKSAKTDQTESKGAEAQIRVYTLGNEFWSETREWALERGLLSPYENRVLEVCSAIPNKNPSSSQCKFALDIIEKLKDEGYSSDRSEQTL